MMLLDAVIIISAILLFLFIAKVVICTLLSVIELLCLKLITNRKHGD